MMIKLFLITLLCATLVFANSPVQNFEDAQPVKGFLGMANHFVGHGSLVRRSAQGGQGGGGGGAGGKIGGGMGGGGMGGGGMGRK